MATYSGTPLRPGRTQTPIQAKRPSPRSLATSGARGGYRATGGISVPEEPRPATPPATGAQALSEFTPRVPEEPSALGQAALGVGAKLAAGALEKPVSNAFNYGKNAFDARFNANYNDVISPVAGAIPKAAGGFTYPSGAETFPYVDYGAGVGVPLAAEGIGAAADFASGAGDFVGATAADVGGLAFDEFGNALYGEGAEAAGGGIPFLGAGISAVQGNWGGAAGNVIGTLAGGPIGGAIGGVIGGALGRVICTELHAQGRLSTDLLALDIEFSKRFSTTTVRGYHWFAVPYVRLMRKSRLATAIVAPIARWRALEVAHQMGHGAPCMRGKIVRLIGEPICFGLGLVVTATDWTTLYKEAI